MAHAQEKPLRILHVLGMMERGGAETWLMHILRMIDRDRYQMDFLVHITEPQEYDDEIRALGSEVILCPHTCQPLRYARDFLRILKERGRTMSSIAMSITTAASCSGWRSERACRFASRTAISMRPHPRRTQA